MEMLKQKKYLGMVGNAITIVGLFLPLINLPSGIGSLASSIPNSFMAGSTGVILLILCVCSLLIIFSDKLANSVPAFEKLKNQKLTLVPIGIAAIIVISNVMNASAIMSLGSALGISYGIGFWAVVVGLVMSVAYPFLYKGE